MLDAIRGFALLGIFIMNMPAFNTSFFGFGSAELWPQWWDRGTETVRDVIFSGKFNSMFSMLFAVGFTIQLERLQAREPQRATWIYLRRLFWLFVFGVIHTCVFWAGDVLHMYALLGLLLLALRRVPDRAIVALIIACLLYPAVMGVIRIATTTPEEIRAMIVLSQQAVSADNAAFGHGSFLDTVRRSTADTLAVLLASPAPRPVRRVRPVPHDGIVRAAARSPSVLSGRRSAVTAGSSRAMVVPGDRAARWRRLHDLAHRRRGSDAAVGVAHSCGYRLCRCRVAIMIFYVATIVRAVCNERWRQRLAPVTLAGRMPLTNYLLQTLIGVTLFYHWGFGLWGKVGPALDLVLAVAIFFIIQVPLTRWWLGRFERGPMEYLWRVLTYGRGALRAAPEQPGEPNAFPDDRRRVSSPN